MAAYDRLRPGDMRNRIRIMRKIDTPNGKGGFTTSWNEIAAPWAYVEGIDGREAVIAQALQGVSYYRLRIWWRQDKPAPADQIKLPDGTDLNIRSCTDPFGDRRELSILADTGSAQVTA